jgi:hypothetical protein
VLRVDAVIQGPWYHQHNANVEPSTTLGLQSRKSALASLWGVPLSCTARPIPMCPPLSRTPVFHALQDAGSSPIQLRHVTIIVSSWMKTSRPQGWNGSSSSPVSYLQGGSISWCVNGMPASMPMGFIFTSLYSTQNNPQMGCIWTSLILLIIGALKSWYLCCNVFLSHLCKSHRCFLICN